MIVAQKVREHRPRFEHFLVITPVDPLPSNCGRRQGDRVALEWPPRAPAEVGNPCLNICLSSAPFGDVQTRGRIAGAFATDVCFLDIGQRQGANELPSDRLLVLVVRSGQNDHAVNA
jgi:hypothetical protein